MCHLAAYAILISFSNCLFNDNTNFHFNVCQNNTDTKEVINGSSEIGVEDEPPPLEIIVGFMRFVNGPNELAKEIVTYIFFGLGIGCTLLLLLGRLCVSGGISPQFIFFPYLIYQMATVVGTFIVAGATAVIQYR